MRTFPLTPDIKIRNSSVIGIHSFQEKIVYVHTALEDIPPEQVTSDTVLPHHIIAGFFSPDFKEHIHTCAFVYKGKKTLFPRQTVSYVENQRLFLNTLKIALPNPSQYDPVAKVFEITESEIREVGESPEPVVQEFSDSKIYYFGDYILRMASERLLECRSAGTNAVVWKLRLTAWLYSELEVKNGILYFGTAGKGGHFYGVSLADGSVIFDIDTGGTTEVVWINNYLAVTDRKGDLVLLNPATGAEEKKFHFKGMTVSAKGLLAGNRFYTVLTDNKEFYKTYAACLEMPGTQ